ncbi:MAG TPA: hypothetical protein PKC80_09155 [Burkholderiaceae bacterium]|nr:hypothetical protein [Burkholderiaceae bacterium]
MSSVWQDEGAWIAIGISVLFLVAAFVMHRVFVRILKNGTSDAQSGVAKESKHD